MNKTSRTLSSLLLAISLYACSVDSYDKGDGENSLLQAEMADIHFDGNKRADFMVTDEDERLTIRNPFTNKSVTTADSTYRFVAYYSKNGNEAEVTGVNKVAVTVPKRIKDMATDPVQFESMWMSKTRRYLNVSIYIMLGTTDDEKAIQTLGCNVDTLMTNDNDTRTLRLTLYHDQGGVPEYYSQRTYISIPLQGTDADSVSLTINSYKGKVEKTFPTKRTAD